MKYSLSLLCIFALLSSCSVTHYLTPEQLGILANNEIFVDALTRDSKTIAVVIKKPDCKEINGEYILSLSDWKTGAILEESRFGTNAGPIEYVHTVNTEAFTGPLYAVLYQYERKQNKKFVRERWAGLIEFKEPP